MKGSWRGPGGKFPARDQRFTTRKNRRLEMERKTTASQNMAPPMSVDSAKGRKLYKKRTKNYRQRNHLNGRALRFHLQTQMLEPHCTLPGAHGLLTLLSSFHLNGHNLIFHPRTQKSEPPCTAASTMNNTTIQKNIAQPYSAWGMGARRRGRGGTESAGTDFECIFNISDIEANATKLGKFS